MRIDSYSLLISNKEINSTFKIKNLLYANKS